MTMDEVTVTDDFGRRTVFTGELLIEDTTDSDEGDKPQWMDIDVWRTAAGSFVVRKTVCYRVVHASASCGKLDGYQSKPSTEDDTYPCAICNKQGATTGWAQADRTEIGVHSTPEALIEGLKFKGDFTRLSRQVLADLSRADKRVDALWNTVIVK